MTEIIYRVFLDVTYHVQVEITGCPDDIQAFVGEKEAEDEDGKPVESPYKFGEEFILTKEEESKFAKRMIAQAEQRGWSA